MRFDFYISLILFKYLDLYLCYFAYVEQLLHFDFKKILYLKVYLLSSPKNIF